MGKGQDIPVTLKGKFGINDYTDNDSADDYNWYLVGIGTKIKGFGLDVFYTGRFYVDSDKDDPDAILGTSSHAASISGRRTERLHDVRNKSQLFPLGIVDPFHITLRLFFRNCPNPCHLHRSVFRGRAVPGARAQPLNPVQGSPCAVQATRRPPRSSLRAAPPQGLQPLAQIGATT